MCVTSMIMDHYAPQFPTWPGHGLGGQQQQTGLGAQSLEWSGFFSGLSADEVAKLRQLLKDFYEARAAAEKIDALTGQKDCVDPDKARLLERVEALEQALFDMRTGAAAPFRDPLLDHPAPKAKPKKRAKRAKKRKP